MSRATELTNSYSILLFYSNSEDVCSSVGSAGVLIDLVTFWKRLLGLNDKGTYLGLISSWTLRGLEENIIGLLLKYIS